MRRRVLLSGLVAGCLVGLLPGCIPAQAVQGPGPLPVSGPDVANQVAQAPLPPDLVSPYHSQAVAPDANPHPEKNDQDGFPIAPNPTAPTPVNRAEPPPAVSATAMPQIINGAAPPPPQSAVEAALQALQDKKPEGEVRRCLARLDPASQELLLRLIRGAADGLNPQDLARFQAEVDEIDAALRTRLPLQVPMLCFCRKIEAFGVYDPLANPVFQAGAGGKPGERAQVYLEVRNFGVRQCGRQSFETALACNLEIRECRRPRLARPVLGDDPSGPGAAPESSQGRVWRLPMDTSTRWERSLAPRQDYFISLQFHIPPGLPPGFTPW